MLSGLLGAVLSGKRGEEEEEDDDDDDDKDDGKDDGTLVLEDDEADGTSLIYEDDDIMIPGKPRDILLIVQVRQTDRQTDR